MKLILLGLFVIQLMIITSVKAEIEDGSLSESMPTVTEQDPINGFQLGIRKGFSEKANIKLSFLDESLTSTSSDFSHELGFSVGYIKSNIQNIGSYKKASGLEYFSPCQHFC